MAKAGVGRIAALEYGWNWTPEGFAFWLADTLHRRHARGEEMALLLLDKRPQCLSLIAGWLERGGGASRYRYRCRVSILCGLEET